MIKLLYIMGLFALLIVQRAKLSYKYNNYRISGNAGSRASFIRTDQQFHIFSLKNLKVPPTASRSSN